MGSSSEIATLGGGCFWCLEAVFEQLVGVESVVSGYCGGEIDNPTYAAVCDGFSGHAEVVQISFDPAQCSYREVLEIFFAIHDPTTLNRQGNDVGTQYRSVIFHHTEEQRQVASALMGELGQAGLWAGPMVTELLPVPQFFAAEDYHQQYFRRNPGQGYCQVVVSPKLAKFRKSFASRLKANR
ncbi:peptide-methionine (S)-S-oxide reductase MsrA [Accumulibacter sp.]|uniref:peptide-methionine (S)-S-oxide reductase MsrA n=1 Tax=Accumulibacter sp. TaxID=2053492 RepID=UPI0028C47706|nr:peptide-methionine (S)-S-oxide reductase MsrA [Accumulibacter sp.]